VNKFTKSMLRQPAPGRGFSISIALRCRSLGSRLTPEISHSPGRSATGKPGPRARKNAPPPARGVPSGWFDAVSRRRARVHRKRTGAGSAAVQTERSRRPFPLEREIAGNFSVAGGFCKRGLKTVPAGLPGVGDGPPRRSNDGRFAPCFGLVPLSRKSRLCVSQRNVSPLPRRRPGPAPWRPGWSLPGRWSVPSS
jgi:hypothetical protein